MQRAYRLLLASLLPLAFGCGLREQMAYNKLRAGAARLEARCSHAAPGPATTAFLQSVLDTTLGSGPGSTRVHCLLFSPDSSRLGALVSYMRAPGKYDGRLVLAYADPNDTWQAYTYRKLLPYGSPDHEDMRASLLESFSTVLKDRLSFWINEPGRLGGAIAMSRSNFGEESFWDDVPWQKGLRIEGAYTFEADLNATNREPYWLRRRPLVVFSAEALREPVERTTP